MAYNLLFENLKEFPLESSSALDILVARGKLPESEIAEGKNILRSVVSMLIGLIKSKTNRVYDIEEEYNLE